MRQAGNTILIISILAWGIVIGGIVYSHIAFFHSFLSNLPESSVLVNGTYKIYDERFWMMIHPIVLISTIIALVLNWKLKTRRNHIIFSLGLYVLVLVITSVYFVPELIAFAKSNDPGITSPAEWKARGLRWEKLSWIRGTVMFAAYVSMLISLTKAKKMV